MTDYENVTVEHDGHIATVTFDRGGSLNAFN
jgi:enoyl-CoA hydratase/carnithine racemase